MIGVLIAAGPGSRMGPFTESRPKCLLPIGGRPLIDWTLDHFRRWSCDPIIVIVGHQATTVNPPGAIKILNASYRDNNILHSFMHAAEFLKDDVLASYSDIWVEPPVYDRLMATAGDIVLAVDMDWKPYYEGREKHPISEAENVYVDDAGRVVRLGKHLDVEPPSGLRWGEFLGLWRMTAAGCAVFCEHFQRLNAALKPDAPFQHARLWLKAYITDMMQELVDCGIEVRCAPVERGWAELDTDEDYQRLPQIAARQRLSKLIEAESR